MKSCGSRWKYLYLTNLAGVCHCDQAGAALRTAAGYILQRMQTTYLVTGATDGIGIALAHALAARGERVIMHGRSAAKLAGAVAEVEARAGGSGAEVLSVQADFAALAEVAALAAVVLKEFPELSVLVNNAGLLTDHRQETRDGFELTLGVNYLAPCLLTRLLLPLLQRNAPARIVNVASTAMGGGVIDLDDLQLTRGFNGWQAYANSKLANVLFSAHLATLLDRAEVVTNALCPGLIDTNFFHTNEVFAGGGYERLRPGMRTPEEGALVPLYLAADPEGSLHHGEFFVRQGRDGRRAVPLATDAVVGAELWAHSTELLRPWLAGA